MRVHLIGVGGTAMATLAALLKHRGFDVCGSDGQIYPPMDAFLKEEGIRVHDGYDARHVADQLDLVIVGNAISRGNPEVEEMLRRRIRYCSLPEAVRDHFLWQARPIVVTGTHGKTTTTALTGWLLAHGGLDPSVLAGGIALNFGDRGSSYRLGTGRDFVIEGDEYDSAFFDKTAKFLKYLPEIAVVANIEFDHADIYPDLGAVRLAFRRLVNLLPGQGLLLVGSDSPDADALAADAPCPVQRFGLSDQADWRADEIGTSPAGTRFRVTRGGRPFGTFMVALLGEHNVRNALAAIAVGSHVGLEPATLADGMRAFRGVKRRLELRGVVRGVAIYDDFAHHPTAVAGTLSAVRKAHHGRRIWAVFEPRSASACRKVFQQAFARAFDAADEVLVPAVYRQNLPDNERLSEEELVADLRKAGKRARHIARVEDIVSTLAGEGRDGDVVVVMSNGNFDGIHDKLMRALASG